MSPPAWSWVAWLVPWGLGHRQPPPSTHLELNTIIKFIYILMTTLTSTVASSSSIYSIQSSNACFLAYEYTVTSRGVNFRYPDRVPLTQFVHIAKKILPCGPGSCIIRPLLSKATWTFRQWYSSLAGIFWRPGQTFCYGNFQKQRHGGSNECPSALLSDSLPLRYT